MFLGSRFHFLRFQEPDDCRVGRAKIVGKELKQVVPFIGRTLQFAQRQLSTAAIEAFML